MQAATRWKKREGDGDDSVRPTHPDALGLHASDVAGPVRFDPWSARRSAQRPGTPAAVAEAMPSAAQRAAGLPGPAAVSASAAPALVKEVRSAMRYPRSDPGLGALGCMPGARPPQWQLPAGQRGVRIAATQRPALQPAASRPSWTTKQGELSQDSIFRVPSNFIEARLSLVDVLH